MAVRVWLDKDGKVLVSPEGNVYLSEQCCCLKEPDPTVCWQLYSATVTTSEDGASKGWSEPWMVDYTCLVSGSEPPGAAEWRYAQAGATRWVSFPGMCLECSSPHGADRPELNLACTAIAKWFASAGIFFDTLYMNVATVVTYAVRRDDDGNSIGREVAGSTVIPNWRLTAMTPDDTEDLIYSQVLGEARRVYAPRWGKSIADPDKTDPYVYWNMVGLSTAMNSYTVYDGGWCPYPLANGVSLLTNGNQYRYATGGQGLMSLTMVGSRYTALPVASTAMKAVSTALGCTVQTLAHFNTDQWGHLELGWSVGGDQWYDPYVHVHAHRIALGAMTPVSECSRHDRDLPRYLTQSMAPLWREYCWISHTIPLAAAADHAIDMALSGNTATPYLSIYGVRCNTWWFRLIGESWDGCPKDDDGGMFQGWSVLYQGANCPAYRYLDKLIPMTVNKDPIGYGVSRWFHEDDDALAAGSTVWRAYSSELGDGHCYSLARLGIDNFPSWRTNLCSNAFEPVSAEVPNLIWHGTDEGKRRWAGANEAAGVGGAWPIQSFWVNSSNGNWFYIQDSLGIVQDMYKRFVHWEDGVRPGTPYHGGEKLSSSQPYTIYNLAGGYQVRDWGPCLVITNVRDGHVPGASVRYEALQGGGVGSGTYQHKPIYDVPYKMVTTTYIDTHSMVDGDLEYAWLDGNGVEYWRGCDVQASSYFRSITANVDPRGWYSIWLVDFVYSVCDGVGWTSFDDSRPSSGLPGSLERMLDANPHIHRDWWQFPLSSVGGIYDLNSVYTYLGTAGYSYDSLVEYDYTRTFRTADGFLTYGDGSCKFSGRRVQAGSGDVSRQFMSPSVCSYHQYVTMLNGQNAFSMSLLSRLYDHSSRYTVYSDLTTVYETWYTECVDLATVVSGDYYGKAYLYRRPIESGAWAPQISLYRPELPDGAMLYTVTGTSFRTRWWNQSFQYTTTVTHDNGDEELVTRWSRIDSSSSESPVVQVRIPIESLGLGTPSFALRTLGDYWSLPGYDLGGAVTSAGTASGVHTGGGEYSFGYQGAGWGFSWTIRDIWTNAKHGEAHIIGGKD